MGIFSNLRDWFVMMKINPMRYMDNYLVYLQRDIKKIDSLREEFNNFRNQHYSNNKRIFDEINNLTNAYSDTKWNTIVEPKLKQLDGCIGSLTQLHNEERRLFDLEIKRLRKRIIALEAKKKNKEPKVTNNPGS